MAVQRRTVHYSGRVQGVGFRYTTVSVARRYAVSGYVQNLQDGRVVLVAEGEESALVAFLADVAETMQHVISRVHSEASPATGEYHGFTVRH